MLGSVKGKAKPSPNDQHSGRKRSHGWHGEEHSRGVSGTSMRYKHKLLLPQHAAPLAIGRVALVSSVISEKQLSENWEPVWVLQTTTMADAPVLLLAWLLQGLPRRPTPVVPGWSARPRWARRRGGDCREPRLCNPLSGDKASSARWGGQGSVGERKKLGRGADRALAVMSIGAGAR